MADADTGPMSLPTNPHMWRHPKHAPYPIVLRIRVEGAFQRVVCYDWQSFVYAIAKSDQGWPDADA